MKHLFRAKCFNGEVVVGYLIKNQDGRCFIKDTDYEVNTFRPDLIPYEVLPDTVVYLPNEELAKRWEERDNNYCDNYCFGNLADKRRFKIKGDELKKCISELKEVSK